MSWKIRPNKMEEVQTAFENFKNQQGRSGKEEGITSLRWAYAEKSISNSTGQDINILIINEQTLSDLVDNGIIDQKNNKDNFFAKMRRMISFNPTTTMENLKEDVEMYSDLGIFLDKTFKIKGNSRGSAKKFVAGENLEDETVFRTFCQVLYLDHNQVGIDLSKSKKMVDHLPKSLYHLDHRTKINEILTQLRSCNNVCDFHLNGDLTSIVFLLRALTSSRKTSSPVKLVSQIYGNLGRIELKDLVKEVYTQIKDNKLLFDQRNHSSKKITKNTTVKEIATMMAELIYKNHCTNNAQDIIFLFNDMGSESSDYLTQLKKEFWEPLKEKLQAIYKKDEKKSRIKRRLLMFWIHPTQSLPTHCSPLLSIDLTRDRLTHWLQRQEARNSAIEYIINSSSVDNIVECIWQKIQPVTAQELDANTILEIMYDFCCNAKWADHKAQWLQWLIK